SAHRPAPPTSARQRFLGERLGATGSAAGRFATPPEGIRVDRARLKANLASARGAIAAEPLYVLLAKYGHPDAHDAVRKLTLEAERSGRSVLEIAVLDREVRDYMKKLTPDERRVLDQPDEYRGLASEVTREITGTWRGRLKGVLPE